MNMTAFEWSDVKEIILKLNQEEKRKKYRFVVLDKVDPWCNYVVKNKSVLRTKRNTWEDQNEFKKISLNQEMNTILCERVFIYRGDITQLEVDAIVNTTNFLLEPVDGAVSEAIALAAGPYYRQELISLGSCRVGEAKVSGAYNLPCKYAKKHFVFLRQRNVIHTVGPMKKSPSELETCYNNCLEHHKLSIKSIAFPCISTGISRFPNRLAAHIALKTVRKFLEENMDMESILFCLFDPIDVEIYETLMQMYFPVV